MIAAIAAVASNGVIGKNNALPWRIPEDMHYFRRMTLGKAVIMGRKTFESLSKPLPDRTNIVLTAHADAIPHGVTVATTPEAALDVARRTGLDIMILGGPRVWSAFMPLTDRLYLTRIDRAYDGDTVFPPVDWTAWRLISEEKHDGDPSFAFQVYDRLA